MRKKFLLSVEMPDGVSVQRMAEYVRDAVSSWGGQLRPPGGNGPDDAGDPLFYPFKAKGSMTVRVLYYPSGRTDWLGYKGRLLDGDGRHNVAPSKNDLVTFDRSAVMARWQIRRSVDSLVETGRSHHSARGATLWALLEFAAEAPGVRSWHCETHWENDEVIGYTMEITR